MSLNTILATAPLTTSGYHIKANGTTLGNSLIWDNGTNVGIGNTNTSYTLDVSGTGRFTSTLLVSGAATFSGFVGINGSPATAFPLEAYINSSTAYSSTSRGNVMRVYNSNTSANIFAGIELGGAGTANDGLAGLNAVVTGSGSAALTFYTRDGGTFAEKVRISSAGNVGIGTSSPSNPLHIQSNTVSQLNVTALSGNTNAQINLEPTGTGIALIGPANNVDFAFRTNATERMRITSGGDIQTGNTVGNSQGLWIKSNTTSGGVMEIGAYCYGTNNYGDLVFNTSNSVGGRMRILSGTPTLVIGGTVGAYTSTNRGNLTLSGSASALLGFHNGTTQTGYIYNDHSVNLFQWYSVSNPIEITSTSLGVRLNVSATSWSPISSDERTKKNFETTQGLIELLQIEPVKYHFIEEDDNKIKRLGFKAQNLQPLIPEMVYSTGKKMEDGSDILTITPDYLLPVLVKAIKELNQQNQDLKSRLDKAGL